VRHIAFMGKMRNSYKILVGKADRFYLGYVRHILENNFKQDLKK